MPRERPVHHPRAPVGPDDDEEDLGIYEDDGSSTSSFHGDDPRNEAGETAEAENQEEVPPLPNLSQQPNTQPDINTARTQTDDECDRGVRRVEIASTPKSHPAALRDPEPAPDPAPLNTLQPDRMTSAATALTQETLRLSENRSIPPRNTPANEDEMFELRDLESRLTGTDSRRACYERAVLLLKTRCTSQLLVPTREQVMPAAGRCLTGTGTAEFFYIRQDKPQPMPPLKVWRGFHGNVYFEPISVSRAPVSPPTSTSGLLPARKQPRNILSRSKTDPAFRQMVVLDRDPIHRQSNPFLSEDLTWLHGQSSTGSLRTQNGFNRAKIPYKREKIIKGSVAKSMVASFGGLTPLAVSGGRCNSPSKAPPFIQSQTQYTNSDKRRMLGSSEYMSLINPDTQALVHIVPARATPTLKAPMASPVMTPHN